MRHRPTANRVRDGEHLVAPHVGASLSAGLVHGVGQLGVGVDEQQGQQLVAAGDMAVEIFRRNAWFFDDIAQR